MTAEVKPTNCHYCGYCCAFLATVEDGRVTDLVPDPSRYPYDERILAGCRRWRMNLDALDGADRVNHPLRRVGERGGNEWERVGWDEALDDIAARLQALADEHGPETLASAIGGPHASFWPLHRFMNLFGSPNNMGIGQICWNPRIWMDALTFGWTVEADIVPGVTECLFIWGTNPVVCNSDAFLGHWIVEAMKRGSELVTIDPQLTWIASKSKYWLRLRPGTDAALALGMMNVIIGEDLVDHDFIDKWTYGYEALAERVKDYPVEKVAEICWVEPELIVEAARFYAKAHPSTIQWGLAVDMSKIGTPTAHAIACLAGITGNIDNPGGNILIDQACGLEFGYNSGIEYLKEGMVEKRLGNSKYNLKKYGFTASSQSDCILVACETGLDEKGDPRPVNMLWIQSANPITNMGQDAPRIYRAMKNVPFICVVDLFKTPFAVACADLLLPCAMSNERDCIRVWFDPVRSLTKCSSFYEAKEDEQIMIDLGHRLNPDAWPEWVKEPRDYMNWRLQVGNCGFTMEELENEHAGMIYNDFRYYKYEKGLLRPDGQPGFMTPTGRYEFYISLFDSWGVDALPYYEEPPTSPVATPELAEEYPLVLTTGKRSFEFFHSEWRQANTTSRELHPVPYFDIHPDTAAKYGLHEGEWAWIENQMGKCRQVVRLNATLDERVVSTEHGWWFPEQEAAEPSLFGVFDCNPNNLIPMCENGDSGYGAPIKCGMAKVYPCTPENSAPEDQPTYQVTATNGYTHGPSHKSDTPSFYDQNK